MKFSKKGISLFLVILLCFSCLAGCGGSKGGDTTNMEIDEPVTIKILTRRHDSSTTDAKDLWFFKYLEYWFAEKGYDVTIDVQQSNEATTQVALLLGTDSLPDLVWGVSINRSQIVQYGVEGGMVLDWSKYVNKEFMPNLTAQLKNYKNIKSDIYTSDDQLFALPYLTPSISSSGSYGTSERLYFRKSWLNAVNMKNPTTQDELLNVFRAFKNYASSSGNGGYAVVSDANFLEKYIWTGLGFYGTEPNKYGYNLMIKDGELVMPAYTESYRDFITFMNTLYKEELISKDYFSMDSTAAQGLMRDKKCGALAYWTLEPVGDDFKDIVCANPITFGDNKNIHVSRLSDYTANTIWASAKTKYPQLLAMMLDYIYSEEGAMMYRYGPKKGEDPLELVDGWYYDDNGNITTDMVVNGTYETMEAYGRDRIYPYDNAGLRPTLVTSGSGENIKYKDSVTGEEYSVLDNIKIDPETNDGYWRTITKEKWSDYATSIRLPGAYLSTEDSVTCSDIITTIQTYVRDQSANFITGKRPLSEIDDFWKELKKLGVEDYLKINREAYKEYLSTIKSK